MFVDRLKTIASQEQNHLKADESSTADPVVFSFPADLTSRERRIVHEAAEEFGLHSESVDGPNGERCVSIFAASSALGACPKPRTKYQGRKRPKKTMCKEHQQ